MKPHWIEYLQKDIWRVDMATLPLWKGLWVRFLRIIILISHGFSKKQIQQGASSLTYYTLLAIVPIIALLVGIARGFELEKSLKEWLLQQFAEQKDVITRIFEFADAALETAHQGILAGVGVVVLLWAGIKIFLYMEHVINGIWEVKKGRSLAKRFTDYLSMLILFPLIIFLASGLTVYLSATLTALFSGTELETIASIVLWFLNLIPIFLICLLFTFLYIFMPNTRVRFFPALWAGILTGLFYQLIQWLYLYFQIGVTKYNTIYGTFAALPLFLIWIHLSWVIILLGAKISFAFQNFTSQWAVS